MAKISDLTALTGAGVDGANDVVPIIDDTETGTARNKKITVNELATALANNEAIDDRVAAMLTEGTNITLTYDDGAGTLTIDAAATSGGISDFNEAVDDRVAALIDAGAGITVTYDDGAGTLTIAATGAAALLTVPTWDFNFTDDADAYIRAPVAMTIAEQDTTGTGTIAYEKSTAAAPDTFSSTTAPITLEAGAKLKVSASSITGSVAVHLERTA